MRDKEDVTQPQTSRLCGGNGVVGGTMTRLTLTRSAERTSVRDDGMGVAQSYH